MLRCTVLLSALAGSLAFSPSLMAPRFNGRAPRAVSLRGSRGTAPTMVWGGKDYLIAPSILAADFAKLGEEVGDLNELSVFFPV